MDLQKQILKNQIEEILTVNRFNTKILENIDKAIYSGVFKENDVQENNYVIAKTILKISLNDFALDLMGANKENVKLEKKLKVYL